MPTMGNFKEMGCRLSLGILLMAVLLPSCSIKEGRKDCPCLLEIDPGAFLAEGMDPDISVTGASGKVTLLKREGLLIASVPKGEYNLSVVSRGSSLLVSGQAVSTVREKEPDSLYAYATALSCLSESLRIRPDPEKQFCTVSLQVGSSEAGDFRFQVRSSCDGLDRFTLVPSSGYHSFVPKESENGLYLFRILRQDGKDGLTIEVIPEDGLDREIPLGRVMREAGYDWKRKDLEDFYLKFDPVLSTLQVRISGWDTEKTFEITL